MVAFRMSLKVKFLILILAALTSFIAAGIFAVRLQWVSSIVNFAGERHAEMADILAQSVSDRIDYEAGIIQARTGGVVESANIALDEKSGAWNLVFSVSPKARAEGAVPSSGESSVDIMNLLNRLKTFKLGISGGAALVDDRSYLIFHQGARPYANKYCSYDDLQNILRSKNRWLFLGTCYMSGGHTFVAYAEVPNQLLRVKALKWYVFVEQDARELLAPVGSLTAGLVIMAAVLIIAAAIAGFILMNAFMSPMRVLRDTMKRFGAGDIECRITLKTSDEMAELAAAFNEMADELKITTTSVELLKKESGARKAAEEKASRIAGEFDLAISKMQSLIKSGLGSENLAKEATNARELAMSESGKVELKLASVEIKSLLKKAVFVYEPKIREKGLDFRVDIPRGEVYVNVDSARIVQSLNTLIEAAIALSQKGRIEIAASDLPDEVRCVITYNGPAMTDEDFAKTMELAIAKRVVENHKGRLKYEKDAAGLSRIILILPKQKK